MRTIITSFSFCFPGCKIFVFDFLFLRKYLLRYFLTFFFVRTSLVRVHVHFRQSLRLLNLGRRKERESLEWKRSSSGWHKLYNGLYHSEVRGMWRGGDV